MNMCFNYTDFIIMCTDYPSNELILLLAVLAIAMNIC